MNFLDFNLKTISYLLSKKNIYVILNNTCDNFARIKEASKLFLNKFQSKNLIIVMLNGIIGLIQLSSGVITPMEL